MIAWLCSCRESLQWLDLTSCNALRQRALWSSQRPLANLRVLILDHSAVNDETLSLLVGDTNGHNRLNFLSVRNCHLSDRSLHPIVAGAGQLQTLDVRHTRVSDLTVDEAARKGSIKHIYVDGCRSISRSRRRELDKLFGGGERRVNNTFVFTGVDHYDAELGSPAATVDGERARKRRRR